MHSANNYQRDLDLNLLRVFLVVAECGSVTEAAARLYLTQPAVSAALGRLAAAVGAPLFAREGRKLALTPRGQRLRSRAAPPMRALIEAASSADEFDPKTCDRVVRLGLSDMFDVLLLPKLVRSLAKSAPKLRLIASTVQFRTVGAAMASGSLDLAVTVADELPAGIARESLFKGGFALLFDPRYASLSKRRATLDQYLAHEHVIVSYNGDLRGVVEDILGISRRVRVSVASFHSVGALVEGSAMVATVPRAIAAGLSRAHPKLAVGAVPSELRLSGSSMDLLSRASQDDDAMLAFVREAIRKASREVLA
ncbi:MAG: LysR family transcriptional regulator [Polyangiales bacterium]